VAVIRKVLFVLSGQKQVTTAVLALLIAMMAVFITGLVVVSRFETSVEPDSSDPQHPEALLARAGRGRARSGPGGIFWLKRLCEWREVRDAAHGRSEANNG